MLVGDGGAQPLRKALGHLLLEEEWLVDAVGIALERQRPVLQMRQKQRRDGVVIIQQIALAIAVLRDKTIC